MKSPYDVIIAPVVSEKSYALIEDNNAYVFEVDPRSTKGEIRDAVQSIFEVRVLNVNTMNRQGKRKRRGYQWGKRKDTKRAVVTLAPGDTIDLFGV